MNASGPDELVHQVAGQEINAQPFASRQVGTVSAARAATTPTSRAMIMAAVVVFHRHWEEQLALGVAQHRLESSGQGEYIGYGVLQ